ncbi:hypothetical protein [Pseudoalteromonas rubra]|uniref:hypothetical protein n=1 Tax=Pseudoalteromonas rubra TaxID=43658 RepID=UPI000F787B93|nr:hypothetical protein [Pseudoalteromonas rubra]
MKLKILTMLFSTMIVSQGYAHSFNCNVSDVTISSGTPDLVYITMGCKASSPHSSGTGNCTATTISADTVVIDGSSELGKRYFSMVLTALASQKTTYISAYGTCPLESPSTPLVYSMKISS